MATSTRWKSGTAGNGVPGCGDTALTGNRYAPRPVIPVLPAYIAAAIKADRKAWDFFRTLSPTSRRSSVVWIHTAKREETRARRLRESLALLAAGRLLGLK